MRRQKAEQVGELVRRFLREEGLETPYNEYRLVEAWPEVMGQGIANYTGEVVIRNRVLHVHLKSSVLRQELFMNRKRLVQKLNEHVGAQVIDDIVFR
jgi:predicted nucleic acid-binding Zn ribbon protein